MSAKKKSLLVLAAFILLAAVFAAVYFLSRPAAQAGQKSITIEVTAPDGAASEYVVETDADYLWDALYPEHLDGQDSSYGKWVTTVDGSVADEENGQYWLFTKDGEWVETSCDTTPIADGDHYEFFIYSE